MGAHILREMGARRERSAPPAWISSTGWPAKHTDPSPGYKSTSGWTRSLATTTNMRRCSRTFAPRVSLVLRTVRIQRQHRRAGANQDADEQRLVELPGKAVLGIELGQRWPVSCAAIVPVLSGSGSAQATITSYLLPSDLHTRLFYKYHVAFNATQTFSTSKPAWAFVSLNDPQYTPQDSAANSVSLLEHKWKCLNGQRIKLQQLVVVHRPAAVVEQTLCDGERRFRGMRVQRRIYRAQLQRQDQRVVGRHEQLVYQRARPVEWKQQWWIYQCHSRSVNAP